MKIEVRYFALFREQTGIDSEAIEWDGGTALQLFQKLAGKHDALMTESAALVAINDEMMDWGTAIADADVVLFFPPVAGG